MKHAILLFALCLIPCIGNTSSTSNMVVNTVSNPSQQAVQLMYMYGNEVSQSATTTTSPNQSVFLNSMCKVSVSNVTQSTKNISLILLLALSFGFTVTFILIMVKVVCKNFKKDKE